MPYRVREQNKDANGEHQVHEQGTASVQGVVSPAAPTPGPVRWWPPCKSQCIGNDCSCLTTAAEIRSSRLALAIGSITITAEGGSRRHALHHVTRHPLRSKRARRNRGHHDERRFHQTTHLPRSRNHPLDVVTNHYCVYADVLNAQQVGALSQSASSDTRSARRLSVASGAPRRGAGSRYCLHVCGELAWTGHEPDSMAVSE